MPSLSARPTPSRLPPLERRDATAVVGPIDDSTRGRWQGNTIADTAYGGNGEGDSAYKTAFEVDGRIMPWLMAEIVLQMTAFLMSLSPPHFG